MTSRFVVKDCTKLRASDTVFRPSGYAISGRRAEAHLDLRSGVSALDNGKSLAIKCKPLNHIVALAAPYSIIQNSRHSQVFCKSATNVSGDVPSNSPSGMSQYEKIIETLTTLFPVWVILGTIIGIYKPAAVTWLETDLFTAGLGFLMLSMGLTLTFEDFKRCLRNPWTVRSKSMDPEADMQKLSHNLKILSESEKQLRMSKHQTTWLTVALLQLSSVESSLDPNDSKLCLRHKKDGDAPRESFKHLLVPGSCDDNKANKLGACEDYKGTLELIWQRAIELCQSNSLKAFLRKQGKLSSLHVNQGLAVAELEFHHHDYVSRAEESWKLIASSLQSILVGLEYNNLYILIQRILFNGFLSSAQNNLAHLNVGILS